MSPLLSNKELEDYLVSLFRPSDVDAIPPGKSRSFFDCCSDLADETSSISTSVSSTSCFEPNEEYKANISYDESAYSIDHSLRQEADLQLRQAGPRFRRRPHVRSPHLVLREIAKRFNSYTLPKDIKDITSYATDLIYSTVDDSVNTGSPAMIGHMTSALPYYIASLSQLITSLNQNTVKTETANTMTFLEREVLCQMHHALYGCSSEFYRKYSKVRQGGGGVCDSPV